MNHKTFKSVTNDKGEIVFVEVPPHPVEAMIAAGLIKPVPVDPSLTSDSVSWPSPVADAPAVVGKTQE